MLKGIDRCTGCGACTAICGRNCIQLVPDREGFRYPLIDTDRCVHCHQCEQVCPLLQDPSVHEIPMAFAVKNRSMAIREESSSGGVFTALAEAVLNKGGVVCAAKYDADFSVVHDFARSVHDLAAFRGAKYAQSKPEHCFSEIKRLLRDGATVLFVGTPCQVAGLSAYLGKPDANLILVDMICHGVPSPKVWQHYLDERKEIDAPRSVLKSVNLRHKGSGWSRYKYSVEMTYADGYRYCVPQGQDWFMRGFTENLYLRPSCENCHFKGLRRCSDLTLGDFWGIWDLSPAFDDNRGISLLLIHSQRGSIIWNEVCGQFDIQQFSADDAVTANPSARNSSTPHPKRAEFFSGLEDADVINLIQHVLTAPESRCSLVRRIMNRFRKK